MREMTIEQARELKRKGAVLRTEDGKLMIPRKVEPEKPVEQPKVPDHTPQILALIKSNAETLTHLASINAAVVSVLNEVAKPKSPKNWRCIVGRSGGKISTIDIVEK
jgi:hypothetical protein